MQPIELQWNGKKMERLKKASLFLAGTARHSSIVLPEGAFSLGGIFAQSSTLRKWMGIILLNVIALMGRTLQLAHIKRRNSIPIPHLKILRTHPGFLKMDR